MAVGTLALTVFLYIVIPKGFFPTQDTGVIQGISQAPASISFQAMEEKQQELAQGDSARSGGREPFLVHRRGRHQYHAEQRTDVDQPEASCPARSERLRRDSPAEREPETGSGIKLYMQPVQNITVDDRVSRTQYQYTLDDPDANELNKWTNRFVDQAEEAAPA